MERMFSMLNKLWGIMILVGILVAACNGRIGSVGTAAIDSSKDAVMLKKQGSLTGSLRVCGRSLLFYFPLFREITLPMNI